MGFRNFWNPDTEKGHLFLKQQRFLQKRNRKLQLEKGLLGTFLKQVH